jgi:hypothetical protein
MLTRRLIRTVAVSAMALLASCRDTCFLVVGCADSNRVAVEGRIVTVYPGDPVPGTKFTLVARYQAGVDSTDGRSDEDGLFSLALPVVAAPPISLALRVMPPGRPGYTIEPLDCKPVVKWGEACVLNTIVAEPRLPFFQFFYRNDRSRPVDNVQVTFRRTGGGQFFGPNASDQPEAATNDSGVVDLFPLGAWSASLDTVIGVLTVQLPAPIGTTVRTDFRMVPSPRFNFRFPTVQLTGPGLRYRLIFADSASGQRMSGVEVRFKRVSGIATDVDSTRVLSNSDGEADLDLNPLVPGTITGDFSITPRPSQLTTSMKSVSLSTFDADSAIVLSWWSVGATGVLHPLPPSPP